MKKNYHLLYMIPALMMCGSCTNDTEVFESYEQVETVNGLGFQVAAPGLGSRLAYNELGQFLWTKGDALAVQKNSDFDGFYRCEAISGFGTPIAEFGCDEYIANTDFAGHYVLYPYVKENGRVHKINPTKGTIDYLFPSTYKYSQPSSEVFSKNKKESYSLNIPMWGVVKPGNDLTLKELGGVFCVKVAAVPTSSKMRQVFTFTTPNNKIAGSVKYAMAGTNDLALVSDLSKANSHTNHVTINYTNRAYLIVNNERQQFNDCVFYIPVPEGEYSNISINVNGKEFNLDKTYTVRRGSKNVIELSCVEEEKSYEFKNKALEEIVLKAYDKDNNGKISMSELEAVKSLKLAGSSISLETIAELTAFPNLESVKLERVDMDVVDFSNLPNLKSLTILKSSLINHLYLNGLKSIKTLDVASLGLQTLDVSGCTSLETLKCFNNNFVYGLNLRNCTSLKNLDCSNSSLNSLDVTTCPVLTELLCKYNNLKSLDLSFNTSLKVMDCSNNPCSAADARHNKSIKVWSTFNKDAYVYGELNFTPAPKFIGRRGIVEVPYFRAL